MVINALFVVAEKLFGMSVLQWGVTSRDSVIAVFRFVSDTLLLVVTVVCI